MTEEDVVSIPAPPLVDLKRKHDDVEPEQHDGLDNNSNGVIVDDNSNAASDSSQAKRPRLEDGLDNVKTQVNGSSMEIKEEEETEIQDAVVEKVEDPIHTDGVDQSADELVNPEDKQQSCIEEINVEECKDVNGGGSSKEEIGKENKEVDFDDTRSTSRMINVPTSKVGVLIGKGGETIRNLQFNSGAKIQILKDSEADPNSALRPVEIIGNVSCIDNAEKLINAVIAEAEAGGSPALVARGHPAIHSMGTPKQIEIKVPNEKVGLIIGRGGETIKNMQTRSGARIQLIPQHPEGDNSQERTVRISGDKRQIDIATNMIKDVMYQNARPSPYSGGYNQPAYRPRGPGAPPQWGSRGPYAPHSMPYDYHRGPYSSQGSHYHSPGYGVYPPQHMPPRGGYGAGWDQRPPHSGPYDYYGRQGAQTSGPVPPPSGHAPSPAVGGPPPSQVSYGYGQSHGPEYGNAVPYSQTGHQQTYGQLPYGGSYTSTGGGQPGYSQMQQPAGRPYGVQQGPVQQGYGPPRPVAAASSGDVPYQGATPAAAAAPSYGSINMAPQQQYGYTSSGGPVQQQTYPSYSSAPPSDSYNNSTQTHATGPAYQQQSVQPASSTHDQPGAQQATAVGYGGQVVQTGGYSSYPSSQPSYGTGQTQNYGYNTSSQDPNYGYGAAPGSQPTYSQAAPGSQPAYSQAAGYEQQTATQPAGYAAAPGSAQAKTQSPQSAYAQYNASQVYSAPR